MKRFIILISFIFFFKCAKEDPKALNTNSVEIKNKFTLDVSAGEGGSVSLNGGEYEEGTEIKITAIPDSGYNFEGWSDGNNQISRVIELKEDLILVANFTLFTYYFFDTLSEINKKTSWYQTNNNYIRFHPQMNIPFGSCYNETFRLNNDCNGSRDEWTSEIGGYIFYDFFNDGKPDLWHTFLKSPWPSNDNSRDIFINDFNGNYYDIDSVYVSLHQIRKQVLVDLNNDNFMDVVLFSSGYDSDPFPGDSLGIFIPKQRRNIYLNDVIGYFHGGATGDINNDGLQDIYSSWGYRQAPGKPTAYINQGNFDFTYDTSYFTGNKKECCYITDELLDLNNDDKIDIISGRQVIFQNESGGFNFDTARILPIDGIFTPLDIDFFDFNNDNKIDIIVTSEKNFYKGARLDVLIQTDEGFINKTQDYIDIFEFDGDNAWWKWLYVIDFDNDGDLDLLTDGLFGDYFQHNRHTLWWENIDGAFKMNIEY